MIGVVVHRPAAHGPRRGRARLRVSAVALVVGWSPLDMGPGHAARRRGRARRRAQLRRRGHLRPPPPDRDPGHRDRDRPARLGVDRPAPVRRPVRPARRAVRRRGRVAARVAVMSTALAWPLYFRVLERTTATAASTVTFIVPAFAILWGAIALGEPIGPDLVLGLRADHRQPRARARGADRQPRARRPSSDRPPGDPRRCRADLGSRRGPSRPTAGSGSCPPSTGTMAPVTNDAAGDSRNAADPADLRRSRRSGRAGSSPASARRSPRA